MSLFDAMFLDPAAYHVWVANRSDSQRGAGTVADPYHGGLVGSVSQFDTIMKLADVAKTNVVVHLGPGTFLTKGFVDGGSGWQIRAGVKIIGSGIDVTILKIDPTGAASGTHVFAISHPLQIAAPPPTITTQVDAAEVMDLTIDCSANSASTATAFGGVRLMGNAARVRRVKIINWGARTVGGPPPPPRAFGIVCLTGDPLGGAYGIDSTGIEECYALSPFVEVTNSAGATITAFSVGHWKYDLSPAASSREALGKSPFIRNCYVNGGDDTFVPSLVMPNGTRATVIATSMAWCRGGVVEGNQIYNVDIGGPYLANNSIRDGIIRNNFMKNVGRGTFLNVGQSGALINVSGSNATVTAVGNVGTVSGGGMNLTTAGLAPGERVELVGGSFAGCYIVTAVNLAANTFSILTLSNGTSTGVTEIRRVLGIGRVVIEGNTVELAAGNTALSGMLIGDSQSSGVGNPPDYRNGDAIVRNNKVRLVDGLVPASSDTAEVITVQGAKNVQVSNSTVDLYLQPFPAIPQSLKNTRSANGTYFSNRTSKGLLVQGYNVDTARRYDELETLTEDAFTMAFLQD